MNNVLSRLKQISSAVMYAAEAADLEVVLERIAEVARELAESKYAALGIPDGEGGLRYFKTAGISDEARAKIPHLPRGHGLIGAIMLERQAIRLEHMSDDPRSVGFPENHPPMNSFLGVPIIAGQQLFGMLYLSDRIDGKPFSDEDQLLIETIAGYAALAIAGAELRQQQSRLNLLEERERIGMELHDGVIQSLYGIGMQVDLLRQSNETIPVQSLGTVVDSLNDVIEDIRKFISELRSRGDRQYTVRQCLEQIKKRLYLPNGLSVSVQAPASKPPFAPAVFESICLIVNEALSNAVRHAQAQHIQVIAEETRHTFTIRISDDGKGFEPEVVVQNSGLGLRNMRHRARIYGGQVDIESKLGEGTTLIIQIPIGSY